VRKKTSTLQPPSLSQRLLGWFDRHGRKDLPWQKNATPYRVWISEIMLQQTQVATVIPYFKRFIRRFPDVATLATAPIDDVLHLWSGLGYYARARNLHKTAQIMHAEHADKFPDTIEQLQSLPGIGRSTAGAILSLAHRQRHAILDGNVKRVLTRYHALPGWPGGSAALKQLWLLAEQHTPAQRVAHYNQAMMDLGATLCTRSRPRCGECPLAQDCEAHRLGQETQFPARKPATQRPVRQTTMAVIQNAAGEVLLQRRPPAGIWGGLWSFPEFAIDNDPAAICTKLIGAKAQHIEHWPTVDHQFSHFSLTIHPVYMRVNGSAVGVQDTPDTLWIGADRHTPVGLATPISRLLTAALKRVEFAESSSSEARPHGHSEIGANPVESRRDSVHSNSGLKTRVRRQAASRTANESTSTRKP
jgi:A/G-specific adenine glycosylase